MPAGTLILKNGSTIVIGNSTEFTKEVKPGDFIGVIVGGTPYTMIVQSVDSSTQITLPMNYVGPDASGVAWYGIPASLKYAITQQSMNDLSNVYRSMITEKKNWQSIFSSQASVTVTLPDNSTFTGPSWGSLSNQLSNKADKTALDLKADKSSLGNSASRNVGTTAGTVAAGDDTRFIKITQPYTIEVGATSSGEIQGGGIFLKNTVTGDDGYIWQSIGLTNGSPSGSKIALSPTWAGERRFFFLEGNTGNGIAANGSWVSSSDKRIKTNIVPVKEALAGVIRSFNGCTYDKDGTPSVGLIAQDVQKECPSAVISIGDIPISTGETIENVLALDTAGIAAAYHTEAIKTLFSLVELAITDTAAAKELLGEIKQQIAEGS